MRPIKFRAYEAEGRGMFNVARYDFADNSVYHHLFADGWHLGEDLVVMQYIGEEDKNGVEIYEGDITRYFTSEGEQVGEVEFKDGRFVCPGISDWTFKWNFVEVLGNKFENLELLEGT